jgi:hypothetical protein
MIKDGNMDTTNHKGMKYHDVKMKKRTLKPI